MPRETIPFAYTSYLAVFQKPVLVERLQVRRGVSQSLETKKTPAGGGARLLGSYVEAVRPVIYLYIPDVRVRTPYRATP